MSREGEVGERHAGAGKEHDGGARPTGCGSRHAPGAVRGDSVEAAFSARAHQARARAAVGSPCPAHGQGAPRDRDGRDSWRAGDPAGNAVPQQAAHGRPNRPFRQLRRPRPRSRPCRLRRLLPCHRRLAKAPLIGLLGTDQAWGLLLGRVGLCPVLWCQRYVDWRGLA